MTKKTKHLFMGGMGASPKAPARSAAKLPPPSATNAATNAAIGRATGITPPTRGSTPAQPPAAIANNPNIQRMQQTISDMRSGAGKLPTPPSVPTGGFPMPAPGQGRMPARQMGSVPAPTSNIGRLAAGPNPMAARAPAPTQNVASGIGRGMGIGMKKGGAAKARGCGIAKRGLTKGRMV